MPQINQIALTISTGDLEGAGTDGDVYLGVCGREFYADSKSEDFERGQTREYIFGDGANVSNPDNNDPRDHSLFVDNVERYPIYLRFQPRSRSDNWFMQDAIFTLNDALQPTYRTDVQFGRGLWLGTRSGLYVHFWVHIA